MPVKKKPIGFIAICQCGLAVGAMDYGRTDRRGAGKLLGQWLHDGCKIEPRFQDFTMILSTCTCETE